MPLDAHGDDLEQIAVKVTVCPGCTALHVHEKKHKDKRKPWELLSVIPFWKQRK